MVNTGRKYGASFSGAPRKALPQWAILNFPKHKIGKRRKFRGSGGDLATSAYPSRRSLLRCYSNFNRTSVPQRVMFYSEGEWKDLPNDAMAFIRKDLENKKAAVEYEFDGQHFVIDFLHMLQMNLKTCVQQPIAWIDEAGSCFFPEIFSDEDESQLCGYGNNHESVSQESCGPHEIKLQLEIDINGMDQSKLKECSGESPAKHVQSVSEDHHVEDSCSKENDYFDRTMELRKKFGSEDQSLDIKLDDELVKNMFLLGMSSLGCVEIIDVEHCFSALLQDRFELFQKQAEITRRKRGDANVRLAWLPSSRESSSGIAKYGLPHGFCSKPSSYGIGVHLAAANCSDTRLLFTCLNKLLSLLFALS